jgi:hypothetical protein
MPARPINPDDHREALRVAFAAARSAADRNRTKLMKFPNVIDVGVGYKFTKGWITSTPAVVVTVLRKDSPSALDQVLPPEVDGIPLDVAPATPLQQLQYLAAKKKNGTRGLTRGAAPPGVPDLEPYLEPGDPLPTVSGEEGARGAGGGRDYREPPDLKLQAVSGAMTLLCHSSPDAGWPTLKPFLAGIEKTLTLAMYDFGAPYIFTAIRDAIKAADGPFIMNLDRKSNPHRAGEMTEEEIVADFTKALGPKFQYATAAVGTLFPNAYHIKVAVRDGRSFWLSSGNLQGSNQPEQDAAKLSVAEQRRLLSGHNREWHVISDNLKLAKTFEAYIKYDVSEVQRIGASRALEAPEMPELVQLTEDEETRAPTAVKIFPPKKFTFTAADPVKVQPLLTPDNYGENVLKLIQSAKETLYFQNQYIKIGKTFPDARGKPGLKDLVDALLDRMNHGVDVKIILRNEGDTRGMLQGLQTYGFDLSRVKLLGGCHNKGIVVDSKVAMVSSQNYSADGVRFNRDAGLIIFHPKVAQFFEKIFLYDWESRAHQRILGERGAMPLLRSVAEAAPAAGTRGAAKGRTLSWNAYYED